MQERIDLRKRKFRPNGGITSLKKSRSCMPMAGRNQKKNGTPPRNECPHNYAQYKWIKHMFARQDELDARVTTIEKFLGLDRKPYKDESQPKGSESP